MNKLCNSTVAFVVMLAGCSSPEPAFYTLQTVPGGLVRSGVTAVDVRRPGLAGYLDRSNIVLKSADYRLDVNSQLRWGEPLGDMIGRVLTQDLSQRLSGSSVFSDAGAITADADMRVEVDIQRFDADSDGQVELVSEFVIEGGHGHKPVASRHVVLVARPASPGAAGLVGAMSELLGRFADQVAIDIQSGANKVALTSRDPN